MAGKYLRAFEGNPVAGNTDPVFGVGGYPTVSIQIVGTISAGTYTPQVSNDGGQTWDDIQVVSSGGTASSDISAAGSYRADVNSFQAIRLLPDSITGDHQIWMFASEDPFSRPGSSSAAAAVDLETVGGNATNVGNGTAGTGTLRVAIASNNTAFSVNATATGAAAADAAASGNPVYVGGRASAAAPADVSGDGDVVPEWRLRNGAAATVITAAGALVGGDATNGLDVDVTRLPALAAGTALIGRASASNETSTIYNGTTAITPKFAVISAASSGDNTLVAAVASNKIRVVALTLVSSGAVSVRFESGAAGTALTGVMPLVASSGFTLPYNPVGWFETAVNTLLNLELSVATGVYGCLTYIEVP